MSRFLSFLCLPLILCALEFKVATYNVENLFDAIKEGNEYEEYTPNTRHGWNEAMMEKKIAHLAHVIKDMDADMVALEEVENQGVLEKLNRALADKKYPYLFYPQKKPRVSIETAFLSRFPIENTHSFFMKDQARGVHRVRVTIEKNTLDIYINHWPAMREKEEERLVYATMLQSILLKEKGREWIVLGDFNSPLEVQKDDWGLAFVEVLKGAQQEGNAWINLWYDLPLKQRYSHSYGKKRTALDHILVANTLFDGKGIEYKKNSFKTFVRPYMLEEDGTPKRWQITDRGRGKHLGEGFSDHLPLTATFHTPAF